MQNLQIAIDGPAGSGKSTVAKWIANKLGIIYLDTGAMYRALTLAVVKTNRSVHNDDDLKWVIDHVQMDVTPTQVSIDGEDVTDAIRTPEITSLVSYVAMNGYVRTQMVILQQKIAGASSVVMDGRDIGTHVLPNAQYKFYLIASVEERAQRRLLELMEKGYQPTLESLINDISKRDQLDSEREHAPLQMAEDAICIDTTQMNKEEVCAYILKMIYGGLDEASL